jgi:hypothetical protein
MTRKRRGIKSSVAERQWQSNCRSAAFADPKIRCVKSGRLAIGDGQQPSAADILRLATPRGADDVMSTANALGSASTLGMFSPVSTGLESARESGPSTATVDSDAARVTDIIGYIDR